MSDNPATVPSKLTRRLAVGKNLIWWDRPIPALMAGRESREVLLFGGFFLAFSIFWITSARQMGEVLYGIPFVLVGLWVVTAPLRSYYKASSLLYALTDRRALILSGSGAKTLPVE